MPGFLVFYHSIGIPKELRAVCEPIVLVTSVPADSLMGNPDPDPTNLDPHIRVRHGIKPMRRRDPVTSTLCRDVSHNIEPLKYLLPKAFIGHDPGKIHFDVHSTM